MLGRLTLGRLRAGTLRDSAPGAGCRGGPSAGLSESLGFNCASHPPGSRRATVPAAFGTYCGRAADSHGR